MRTLPLVLLTVLFFTGCAAVPPSPDAGRQWTHICYPGSAIKRRVADASAYPDWMIVERGSCLYR